MTQSSVAPTERSIFFHRHRLRWFVVATILLVAVVRLRLLNLPLERDEGEYAYAGQLLLQGVPPYQLAGNMKFPGTYAAYAIIMAGFWQTTFQCVHLFMRSLVVDVPLLTACNSKVGTNPIFSTYRHHATYQKGRDLSAST